jgi:hypothetical protein
MSAVGIHTHTSLLEVDITDRAFRRTVAELLPTNARSACPADAEIPLLMIEDIVATNRAGTVGDLILELTITLTDGRCSEQVEIDVSRVELVPTPLECEAGDIGGWVRLAFDLSRPNWTVVATVHAVKDPVPPTSEGLLSILVRPGLDFREWLTDERTRAMLSDWYLQYQIEGLIFSESQLAELHDELRWIEESAQFLFAHQLFPRDSKKALWRLQEIREAGGAQSWARQLWERCDRPAILASSGSADPEEVIGELVANAELLLAQSSERGSR